MLIPKNIYFDVNNRNDYFIILSDNKWIHILSEFGFNYQYSIIIDNIVLDVIWFYRNKNCEIKYGHKHIFHCEIEDRLNKIYVHHTDSESEVVNEFVRQTMTNFRKIENKLK